LAKPKTEPKTHSLGRKPAGTEQGRPPKQPAPRVSKDARSTPATGIDDLRGVFDRQRRDLNELASHVDSLLEHQEWIQSGLYDLNLSLTALERGDEDAVAGRIAAAEAVRGLREIVRRMLPRDASVLVVSRGDGSLLDLYGRRAGHFPQLADGGHAGFHPYDGTAVVAHLEALRSAGAEYLVFPQPSLWWLESYPKFTRHLHRRYQVVVNDPERYVIFALARQAALDACVWRPRLVELVEDHASEVGIEPAVLDWNTGLELEDLLPNQAVFCPPTDEPSLPYLDQSVEIVVVLSPDENALREGRRVAGHAIVKLERSHDAEDPFVPIDANEHLDTTIEYVNGGFRRTTPSSSIIIPTHNGWENLCRCLASLEETLPHPFDGEVIVVDDASGPQTRGILDEWEQSGSRLNPRVERNPSNRGFVESCNRGAAVARGDIIVFLNDDTVPQFGWLSALLRIFRTHPGTGAVGGKLLYPDGRLQEAGGVIYSDGSGANFGHGDHHVDDPLYGYVREVDYCSAALLATPRDLFAEMGGFDERYRPAYYEDTDYCFALRDRGYKVYYQPESVVVHIEGATGGTDLSSGTKKHQVGNRTKFARKWAQALREQPEPPSRQDLRAWYALATRGRTT